MPVRFPSRDQVVLARELRQAPTPAEEALWDLLRDRRFLGQKFRRQVPVGPFFADFLCERLRLIVELDGGVHDLPAQKAHDENRDAVLHEHGYTVLRLRNEDVLPDPQVAARKLRRWVYR